ncbi:hypothetical protein Pmani_033312 [Petrolisthes manimaculis]|uniref:Uncharacterized protein n=1 Tax=Petrolisthes manimaculis TaxID=1843537 RepID=A0AAE1NPR4_9EUCA|nr:hypothetical protein Pmani_033312 [Petrolisthes manimaculis]
MNYCRILYAPSRLDSCQFVSLALSYFRVRESAITVAANRRVPHGASFGARSVPAGAMTSRREWVVGRRRHSDTQPADRRYDEHFTTIRQRR